jgi:hypothetical protein
MTPKQIMVIYLIQVVTFCVLLYLVWVVFSHYRIVRLTTYTVTFLVVFLFAAYRFAFRNRP